jgi:hypothetical protein
MTQRTLPLEAQDLIDANAPSMRFLEVLLLLARTEPRRWSAEEITTELAAPPTEVAAELSKIVKAGLAGGGPRPDGAEEFIFAPAKPALRTGTEQLAELYLRRPVTLINALYARQRLPAQAFADAFKLRKEAQ